MQIEVMCLGTIREKLRCREVGGMGDRGGGGGVNKVLNMGGQPIMGGGLLKNRGV